MAQAGARHLVQFYEEPRALAGGVATFMQDALRRGGCAAAIARPDHLAAIERALVDAGHDLGVLRTQGRVALHDAPSLMSAFMVEGTPDRTLFQQHVVPIIEQLRGASRSDHIHIYGEIVDILWAAGNSAGVMELERLWSELIPERSFSLLCGYRLGNFDRDVVGFEAVCSHHDAGSAARVFAQLEHRASALEKEVVRRTHLEQRMLSLLELTAELAGATNRQQIGALTIESGVRTLGAAEGAMWTLGPAGTHLQLLAASPSSVAHARYPRVSTIGDTPLAHAVRTGEPVFLGSLAEYAERFPSSRARIDELGAARHQAFAVLPLLSQGRTHGGIVFAFDRERQFLGPDRAFKAILARQCSFALARVEQHEEERTLREAAERAATAEKEARRDIELLYELIASANQVTDVDVVYRLALDTVRTGAHSERAAVLLFDPDGVMRFKAAQGLSDSYQRAVEGHSPWRADEPIEAGGPAPIAVNDTEADPAWAAYRDVFRAEGIRALAFVPIVHQRRLIGKFMLYRDEPRAFDLRDLQFASTVAVHVAQAVERTRNEAELARAYREERAARLLADEAIRAREEILSVVSHDLRNPLGAILMGATSLLNVDAGDRSPRTRTIAERIHRQTERMARLIEDLVDFAGIEAGRLAIQRRPHQPEAIISATSEIFTPLAEERGLRFETRVVPGLPSVECDPDRAIQVLSNLVANALKVTPRGGAISIGVEPTQDEIVFYVRDTGPGIAEDELPRLFERYWRSKQTSYKGAGLGLSIARGIVHAHGGRIWAESRVGRGSTFYFSLASLRNN